MKRITVDVEGIMAGMSAAEDVRNSEGKILAAAGEPLESRHWNIFKAAGLMQVEVLAPEEKTGGEKIHISNYPESFEMLKSARLMIVDDSKLMRLKIRKIITEAGMAVVGEAADGLDAIKLAREINPDCITLDIEMPNLDGLSALPRLREAAPDAKIIMISSLGQENSIMEATSLGADGFIEKPFEPGKTMKTIINALITSNFFF